MAAIEYLMKKIYAWAREYKFGDYSTVSIPSEELMVPSISPIESLVGLDAIGEHNLENMMEGYILSFIFLYKN